MLLTVRVMHQKNSVNTKSVRTPFRTSVVPDAVFRKEGSVI